MFHEILGGSCFFVNVVVALRKSGRIHVVKPTHHVDENEYSITVAEAEDACIIAGEVRRILFSRKITSKRCLSANNRCRIAVKWWTIFVTQLLRNVTFCTAFDGRPCRNLEKEAKKNKIYLSDSP